MRVRMLSSVLLSGPVAHNVADNVLKQLLPSGASAVGLLFVIGQRLRLLGGSRRSDSRVHCCPAEWLISPKTLIPPRGPEINVFEE